MLGVSAVLLAITAGATGVANQLCRVGPWESWTACSATCGGGLQAHTRPVTRPGISCPRTRAIRSCNTQPCGSAPAAARRRLAPQYAHPLPRDTRTIPSGQANLCSHVRCIGELHTCAAWNTHALGHVPGTFHPSPNTCMRHRQQQHWSIRVVHDNLERDCGGEAGPSAAHLDRPWQASRHTAHAHQQATKAPASTRESLCDLIPTFHSVASGKLACGKPARAGDFAVGGHPVGTGLFALAPSRVDYDLSGRYAVFSACAGLGGAASGHCGRGAIFRVIIDGKELWSASKAAGEAASCFRVDVSGKSQLKLVVENGKTFCDDAVWANPTLQLGVAQSNSAAGSTRRLLNIEGKRQNHFCGLGAVSGDRHFCECRPDRLHGMWGSYSSWGSCSVTCGSGRRTRTRACNNPAPRWGGDFCTGSAADSQPCHAGACPMSASATSTAWRR